MAGDALIFIPGIKGTKLVDTNKASWDTIWSAAQFNFESIIDLDITEQFNGEFYDENPNTVIQAGEIEGIVYSEFLRDLKTDKPIYIFNYDWRMSAAENGLRITKFMDYLIAKSKAKSKNKKVIKKFDFVTHSLGNAILRNLIKRESFTRINKIVFTVPPFKGSLDIVATALIGEGFFPGVKRTIRKLIRTMPGALELLPTYAGASYFLPKKAKHDFFNFLHWQGNVKDGDATVVSKMKKALKISKATVENELADLSKLTQKERDKILILVRGGFDTWQSVPVVRDNEGFENYVDFDNGVRTKAGDGRVPHESSCVYSKSIQTLMLEDSIWYKDYSHGMFLKDERAQRLVNRFLFDSRKFSYKIPGKSITRV